MTYNFWKRLISSSLLIIAGVLVVSTPHALAESCEPVNGEYLLKIHSADLDKKAGIRASRAKKRAMRRERARRVLDEVGGGEILKEYEHVGNWYRVKREKRSSRGMRRMKSRGELLELIPNCRRYRRVTPNDTSYALQWSLNNDGSNGITEDVDIDAPEGWDLRTDSSGVVVAVVDTGVDFTHEDLDDNMWVNTGEIAGNSIDDDANGYVDDVYGANVLEDNGDVQDDPGVDRWHGTHVAGLIGAEGNNGQGITGVAWNASIMAVKIFEDFADGAGGGSVADVVEAWNYIIDMKQRGVNVRVVNNSFGATEAPTQAEIDAVEAGGDEGILFVFSAGNEGFDNDEVDDTSNIGLDNSMSVGATTSSGIRAGFSNYGLENVALAAPGVGLYSTTPGNNYDYESGTSFSAPIVSGVAALVFAEDPTLTPAQVKTRLMSTITSYQALDGVFAAGGNVNLYRPLLLSNTLVCTPSQGSAPTRPGGDSDGDGVTDAIESTDGTNASDRGSFKTHLSTPVYSLWTGFLGIVPIAEVINTGTTTLSARVSLFSIQGSLLSSTVFNLAPGDQRDVIVRDMAGFVADSYGLVRIDYCNGSIDGRMSYYRETGAGSYDFGYSLPFSAPLYGESAVAFNTFQPSANPVEANDQVANWLSIVNLASSSKYYTINRYNQSGTLLTTSARTIPAGERLDIEAGHENPGPSNVGLIRIIPSDADAPYFASIARFGFDAPPGGTASSVTFAFSLNAKAGNGEEQITPLTTTLNSQNWLEVANASASSVPFTVQFYRSDGTLSDAVNGTLDAFSQLHFNANSRIGDGQTGFAKVSSSSANSLLATSMVYLGNTSGSTLALYGSQAREVSAGELKGSFNLFLNMFNWLKVINPNSTAVSVRVTANNSSGETAITRTIPANGSIDFGLHESTTFGTAANTLGVVDVESLTSGKSIFAELIRLRPNASSTVDFIFPTEVRNVE